MDSQMPGGEHDAIVKDIALGAFALLFSARPRQGGWSSISTSPAGLTRGN